MQSSTSQTPRGHAATRQLLEPSSSEAIPVEKCCDAIRHYLDHLPALFRGLTGLRFDVAWATTWPGRWREHELPTHSLLCRRVTCWSPIVPSRCRACASRHLALALESGRAGHQFTCPMGVRNYWLPIRVRETTAGLAFIQTLDYPAAATAIRDASPAKGCRRTSRTGTNPAGGMRGLEKRKSRVEFKRAALLLQLVSQYAEGQVLAELRREDLAKAQMALGVFKNVQERLRKELNGFMPTLRKTAPVPGAQCRSEQIVHAVVARIHRHYAEPLTLRKCAADLGVNAAYLSHLFSQGVGLPFKMYLTEVRMEKARELLGNPARNVSQVASAVGYASEERFRASFKKLTSLAPSMWRQTMQLL